MEKYQALNTKPEQLIKEQLIILGKHYAYAIQGESAYKQKDKHLYNRKNNIFHDFKQVESYIFLVEKVCIHPAVFNYVGISKAIPIVYEVICDFDTKYFSGTIYQHPKKIYPHPVINSYRGE